MKEVDDFHMIESEDQRFVEHAFEQNLFEEEKIAHNHLEPYCREVKDQSLSKRPKIKKVRKLSIKNNAEDNSPSKGNKIKQKKFRAIVVEKEKNPNQMFGHWSVEQNKRYHWFLQIYHSHFMNRNLRRMDRIFTSMAKFVGTREAQQCRSHHQKMEKKHKTFTKILLALRMTYYGNCNNTDLTIDIQRNNLTIIESLLSESFLVQNPQPKEALLSVQNEKEDQNSQNDEQEEKPHQRVVIQEKKKPEIHVQMGSNDLIEEVLGPQLQSSNFKLLSLYQDRNNILDDGYERNLQFHDFF